MKCRKYAVNVHPKTVFHSQKFRFGYNKSSLGQSLLVLQQIIAKDYIKDVSYYRDDIMNKTDGSEVKQYSKFGSIDRRHY